MTRRKKQQAESPKHDRDSEKPVEAATKPSPAPEQRPLPEYTDPIDDTLDDSFPASDPPSWAGR